jgi:hypothetical protein
MIDKELLFNYDMEMNKIYNITMEDNDSFIDNIEEIKEYKNGEWKNNKRKDNLLFDIKEIPSELNGIQELIGIKEMIGMKGTIVPLKIKHLLKKRDNDEINLKTKIKLRTFLGNTILKIVKIRAYIIMKYKDKNKTEVKVKYTIKNLLPKKISDKINNLIIDKIENNFVIKIDNYLKNYV